jgi:hypothetical protein
MPDATTPEAWYPFDDRISFDFADYHFVRQQSSEGNIDRALNIWAAQVLRHGERIPWASAKDLYNTIDTIREGQNVWKTYRLRYNGPLPTGTPPKWMTQTYELYTRDTLEIARAQLGSEEFRGKLNYTPYRQFNKQGQRVISNLMSGDWAWKQAVS